MLFALWLNRSVDNRARNPRDDGMAVAAWLVWHGLALDWLRYSKGLLRIRLRFGGIVACGKARSSSRGKRAGSGILERSPSSSTNY